MIKRKIIMSKVLLFIISFLLSASLSAQFLVNDEQITLETPTGELFGVLRVPYSKTSIPVALIITGSGSTDRDGNQSAMKINSLRMLSEGLYYNKIASLCFDKRGIAQSKDAMVKAEGIRFEHFIDDVKKWIDLLASNERFSEIIVVGHSEGSLIGMVSNKNNPKVSKFVSLAGAGESVSTILKEQLGKQGQKMLFPYVDKLANGEYIENVPAHLNVLFGRHIQPFLISCFKYNPIPASISLLDLSLN